MSLRVCMIGGVFENLADVDDAALVDAISGSTHVEATAAAYRLAAIAELTERRITSCLLYTSDAADE